MKKKLFLLFIASSLILYFVDLTAKMQAQEQEPIAYMGHGAFFDQDGKQIEMTQEFVSDTQNWYRAKLRSSLSRGQKAEYAQIETGLSALIVAGGQDRLLVQQYLLDILTNNLPETTNNKRMIGKLNALKYEMNWKLPNRANIQGFKRNEIFKLNSDIERKLEFFKQELFKVIFERKLKFIKFTIEKSRYFSDIVTNGEKYKNDCRVARVPIPPTIGLIDSDGIKWWKSLGFIPPNDQFVQGTKAELFVYQTKDGVCFALSRYRRDSETCITQNGVICLGYNSSKACFWDNQMNEHSFPFSKDRLIPIGVPDTENGQYLGGGNELGEGFICTDCHAGQNPFIIHPKVKLQGGLEMGNLNILTFSVSRYIPLVKTSWPLNQRSLPSQSVPPSCIACHHIENGGAGAFPYLSSALNGTNGYCKSILKQAIGNTMPLGNKLPPHEEIDALKNHFKNLCGTQELPRTPRGDGPFTLSHRKKLGNSSVRQRVKMN